MPTITEALQSSWHVHGMRNKQPRTQEMYTRGHEPECAVQSEPCQGGNRWIGERQSIIAPWGLPNAAPSPMLGPATHAQVLCFVSVRGTGTVRLYMHTHSSGNALSDNA